MARQRKLPQGRVLERAPDADPDVAVIAFDLHLVRKSKSYQSLKADAPTWSDADILAWLLSGIAQGVT